MISFTITVIEVQTSTFLVLIIVYQMQENSVQFCLDNLNKYVLVIYFLVLFLF